MTSFPRLFLGFSGLLLLLHSATSQQTFNCTYSAPVELSDDVTLEHYVNAFDNTITFRMTYEDGYAWLGLGVNTLGLPAMAPALAVIGDWDRRIQRYALESNNKNGEGVLALPDEHGHLKNGFFLQEDDQSVLVFSQDMILFAEDPVEDAPGAAATVENVMNSAATVIAHEITVNSTWIWAVGRDDNRWDGRHKLYGSFILDLFDGCQAIGGNDDIEPIPVPVPAPVPSPSKPSTPQQIPVLPEGDIMGDTVPVPVYNDEDLNESNVFDEIAGAEEELETEQEQQAHLFYASTRLYWIFHGILMGFALGVLAPLAVGAALWRNRLDNHDKTSAERVMLWTRLQRCLSLSVAVLTVLGFLLAILAKRQAAQYDDDDSETATSSTSESMHAVMGMIILAMLLAQGIAEYMRRCLPKSNPLQAPRDHASQSIQSAHDNPSAHVMMIDGFAQYDRRQPLPPQEGEVPAPYGNGRDEEIDDVSLLTSSIYSGHFATLNLSSVLGEGSDFASDMGNDQILGDPLELPSPAKEDCSLPNTSLQEDKSQEIIFVDDEDQSWQQSATSAVASRRQTAEETNDRTTNEKNVTPATSPDTSREEAQIMPASDNRRPRLPCSVNPHRLASCWSTMLLCTSIVIMALGWYNCHTGIILQSYLADMEDFEAILLAMFWGFAVGIAILTSVTLCLAKQSSDAHKQQRR